MKNNTRKIVISAMLIGFDVIFTRLLAVNVLVAKVGLGFAAVGVCAMLYGPAWAGVCAGLGDLVGSLLFPTGAYFPGFTVTAAITGVVFGLFLYGHRPKLRQCFFAAATNCVLVTLLLNSLMIALVYSPPLRPLLAARSVETALMLVIETAVLWAIGSSDAIYEKIIEKNRKNP